MPDGGAAPLAPSGISALDGLCGCNKSATTAASAAPSEGASRSVGFDAYAKSRHVDGEFGGDGHATAKDGPTAEDFVADGRRLIALVRPVLEQLSRLLGASIYVLDKVGGGLGYAERLIEGRQRAAEERGRAREELEGKRYTSKNWARSVLAIHDVPRDTDCRQVGVGPMLGGSRSGEVVQGSRLT